MFSFNTHDGRPIYEQLVEYFRKLIITGAIKENEKLPSVRELAASSAINPNTIQRAYRELDLQGYVYTVAGKGCFAASGKEIKNDRSNSLIKQFEHIGTELLFIGFTKEELKQHIDDLKIS